MSQNDQILKYLEGGHTLTAFEALRKFGCLRLAARICDLREQGATIGREWEQQYGKRYARYYLYDWEIIDG